jgi:hypothetical protein
LTAAQRATVIALAGTVTTLTDVLALIATAATGGVTQQPSCGTLKAIAVAGNGGSYSVPPTTPTSVAVTTDAPVAPDAVKQRSVQ